MGTSGYIKMSGRRSGGRARPESVSQAFDQIKSWTSAVDQEISRLEEEVRRKARTCSFDEANGCAAPVCDNIRDSVAEMTDMVKAMVRSVFNPDRSKPVT